MALKHTYQSAVADGGDTDLVQPSDWNAEHSVDSTANTPSASKANLLAQDVGGRIMLGTRNPDARSLALQPFMGRNKVGSWMPTHGDLVANGMRVHAYTGTNTSRVPAATNMFTSLRRCGVVSGAGAGAQATVSPASTVLQFWRGDAAGLGGFHAVFRFGVSDAVLVATANMFVGLRASFPADTTPSTATNLLGIGCDNGDTVMQLYAAGGSAQARTSLGASFPVNTISTDVYELVLYCPPNGSDVKYAVTRLNTGDTTSGTISVSANLPGSTTFLGPYVHRSNGGTAAAVGIDLVGVYIETEA